MKPNRNCGSNLEMPKRSIPAIPILGLISALTFLPALPAQTAPPAALPASSPTSPTSVDAIKIQQWNSTPLRKPAYAGIKPAPAPRHDLAGIWDATGDTTVGAAPGIQATGAHEYPARSEERRVGKECRSRWSPYH